MKLVSLVIIFAASIPLICSAQSTGDRVTDTGEIKGLVGEIVQAVVVKGDPIFAAHALTPFLLWDGTNAKLLSRQDIEAFAGTMNRHAEKEPGEESSRELKKLLDKAEIRYIGQKTAIAILSNSVTLLHKNGNQWKIAGLMIEAKDDRDSVRVQNVKPWSEVAVLRGSNNKRSELFLVSKKRIRLSYTVSGNNPAFVVYVLPDGKSLDKDGGFPEVDVSKQSIDSTFLVLDPGRYYLDVKAANCDWDVSIEEQD